MKRLDHLLRDFREERRHRLRYLRQTIDCLRGDSSRYRLKIVCLDVNHGDSTLIIFPTGRVALIDSAKEAWCRRRVIPFLKNHQIGQITYYITTHYHEDHVGRRDQIIRDFLVNEVWDYRTHATGTELELEGTRLLILNSYPDSEDENDRSLAFQLACNGFVYTHGADLYADGQRRILERFPGRVRTHVYRANHHFHGSVDREHLLQADPVMVVISGEEAVYQRVAYTRDFNEAVQELRKSRLREVCFTLEKGNVVIFANGEDDWSWSSYSPNIILSGLYP